MVVDIAIVGGGPAATSIALCLRRAGQSVCVVAARGSKQKPTETCNPKLRRLLKSFGAESALACCKPCHGIVSDWSLPSPAFRTSMLDPFGHAWFIDRKRFDLHMERLAKESGATWIEATAGDADFERNCVILKTTSGPVSAKWLVIANGSLHWASRVTKQSILTEDSLIASWARLDSILIERCLLIETCDTGWWYMCPDSEGRITTCFVTDLECKSQLKPFKPERWNELFLQTRLSKFLTRFQPAVNVKALRTGLAALPIRHGSRWISIGDAAVLLDPFGSSGTVMAIESATRASAAIEAALRGDETELQFYEAWSQGMFREFTRQRAIYYKSEIDFWNSAFWRRRKRVQSK